MSKDNQVQTKQQAKASAKPIKQQEVQTPETAVTAPIPSLQSTCADPRTLSPADAQALQRTIGNQALRRLSIQRKMTVGPVGDKFEQEADAVAKQVVNNLRTPQTQSRPSETAQRQEEEELQMKSVSTISSLQRQEEEEMLQGKRTPLQRQEEEELQTKGDPMWAGGELNNDMEGAVHSAKSGGQQLDDTIRQPMEQAFNADFSSVKIHTDSQSDTLNRSLSARAFTSGQDVFFRQGEYNPSSNSGQELLAHELTHVVQQNGNGNQAQREISSKSNQIQRMAFEGTNWASANSAIISKGGGGGVFIIQDKKGTPIVVKPSEESSGEAVLFSQIFSQTMEGDEKAGNWKMETPGVRLADHTESMQIADTLDRLIPNSDDDPRIERSKDALIDPTNPTVIYSYAKGEEMAESWRKTKGDKQGPKTKDRLKAVSNLWNGSGLLHLLGKATAVDIFMGNNDRFFLFNPENFMVDVSKKKKRLTLIDNVFDQEGSGGRFSGKSEFMAWVGNRHYSDAIGDMQNITEAFKGDQFNALAIAAVGKIWEELAHKGLGDVDESIFDEARTHVDENWDNMVHQFESGLESTKGRLLIAVQQVEHAMKNQELNVGNKQHDILTHLKARKLFLLGADADEAWRMATGFNATGRGVKAGFTMGSRNNVNPGNM